jgi:hypothetical protein
MNKAGKFTFMMKHGPKNWFKNLVQTNAPELHQARLTHVESRLKEFGTDELKKVADTHPNHVVKTLAMYELNDRGVEGY